MFSPKKQITIGLSSFVITLVGVVPATLAPHAVIVCTPETQATKSKMTVVGFQSRLDHG